MVDNSIALQIKPYGGIEQQLNPLNMLLAASKLRNSDTENELQKAQLQQANTEIAQKKAALIGQLAGQVLKAPDDQLVPTYKETLGEARKAGILDDSGYQQALSRADTTPPAQLRQMLTGLQTRGLPIEQQVAQQNRAEGAGQIAEVLSADKPPAQKYFDTLTGKESGGNPNAVPTLPNGQVASSARGPTQILRGTWDDLAAKNPTAGLTPEGFDGTAKNSAAQRQLATKMLTAQNAEYLVNNDIQPTDKNLYMAHFLGAEGATKFIDGMKADPNAPATSLVSPEAVKANPSVFLDSNGQPKTALGVYNSQTSRFYGGSTLGLMPDNPEASDRKAKVAGAVLTNPNIDSNVKVAILGQLEKGKLKFTQIGEDMLGNKQFGFVDETNKKTYDQNGKQIQAGEGGSGAAAIPTGPDGEPLKGPELLANLEKTQPAVAAGVKGIIAGDISATGRNLQKLMPLAKLVDPSLDQFDYDTRKKTQIDFTSGSSAKEIKAINTAIYHAGQLAQTSDNLGGINVLPGFANPVIQGIKRNVGDQTYQEARKGWDATSETLSTEIAKALNGGSPHAADKEHWRKVFEAAGSPQERDAAIKAAMVLLEGRTHALSTAYERGMGRTRDGMSFIDAPNQTAFQELMTTGKIAPKAAAVGAPSAPAAPAAPAAPSGAVDWRTYFGGTK